MLPETKLFEADPFRPSEIPALQPHRNFTQVTAIDPGTVIELGQPPEVVGDRLF
jgi:hypothetical protein